MSDNTPIPVSVDETKELDLSEPADVLTYLANTPFASTRAETLSGGNANFVFRLHLTVPFEGRDATLVLKHAKPWLAMDRNLELAIERQEYEAMALRRIGASLPADAIVTVPVLHFHDQAAHVLIMEDCGTQARTLKELLRDAALGMHAARALGGALGRFLAAVHVRRSTDAELLEYVACNEFGKRVSVWATYGRLVGTLEGNWAKADLVEPSFVGEAGLSDADVEDVKTLVDVTTQAIQDASTFFTMGDFWTGNIIVRLSDSGEVERAYVVDWEMCRPGLPYLDFGQLIAEMHTSRWFSDGAAESVKEALEAYSEAYKENSGALVDEAFVRGAAAHVGVHMVVWTPRVSTWGPMDKVRRVMQEGAEYVLRGKRGDMDWLRTSVVGGLLVEPEARDS
ncbi:hypothetical protein M0805_004115 [Coniferiporia weirii]|nr:hypothetical protein M0805_004115 [Coniferiporia weirii]